ncbi:hypothetical protein [Corynebacterium diphtheriae]|uniref:hypothetical protein n=1 Tax=Corynebacterium diphtheriae TaxID=1717 RepID=UPI001436B5F1|nr:hypothetical protein [Corynebacterium diphtheriae]
MAIVKHQYTDTQDLLAMIISSTESAKSQTTNLRTTSAMGTSSRLKNSLGRKGLKPKH